MNEYPFQFSVLRYVHDPMTEEFINIGVVVYSKEARYLKSEITPLYRRISGAFQAEIDGAHYRQMVNHISRKIENTHSKLQSNRMFEDFPIQIEVLLATLFPLSDSSLVFGRYGGGLVSDLDAELTRLYGRLVMKYAERKESGRDERDVWKVYRRELEKYNIPSQLEPVTFQAKRYEYVFDYAWRNERWHPLEPISFDLVYGRNILEKANKWIGRVTRLAESEEREKIGTLYLLLGAPQGKHLMPDYEDAKSSLANLIPIDHEVVDESDAGQFSQWFARIISNHQAESVD